MSSNWVHNYLRLAEKVSTWSKDPSTQVGAVAVGKHGQILSQGYNGFPRGIDDTEERLNNREQKYKYVVHAEQNCIYNATLNGVSLDGADLYIWGLPLCSECAKGVIQVGIRQVFMCYPKDINEKWTVSHETTREMLDEAEVRSVSFMLDETSNLEQAIEYFESEIRSPHQRVTIKSSNSRD